MQLVIDIPEEVYKNIQKYGGTYLNSRDKNNLEKALKNGIPLPNITDIVHKTIYSFFDIADDNSEEPINEKDKLLLEINKAICNNIKGWVLKDADIDTPHA